MSVPEMPSATIQVGRVHAVGAASETLARAPTALPDSYSQSRAWFSVAILLIFTLLSILDRQIIALLVEPIKSDLKLSDTELGLLQGIAFAILYSIAGLPVGWAVDRYSRRTIAFVGVTLWSFSAASCGLARNFWQLFIGRAAVGIGEATIAPVAVSLISDLFPKDRVATPMGIYAAGYYIGGGLALGFGGWIVGLFAAQPVISLPLVGNIAPWQAVFIATGFPGVVLAFLAFLLHDRRPAAYIQAQRASPGNAVLWQFFASRWKVTAWSFAAFALATAVIYAISAWTPAYFARVFGWRPADIGWTFGLVVGIAGAVGSIGSGILIDRVYRAGRSDACFVVPAIGAVVSMPFLAGAYFMSTPFFVLGCLAVGLLIFGSLAAASYATWQQIAPPTVRGQLTAAFILFASLFGIGLGPVAVALVTDRILGNEAMVGKSIAIVVSIALPLATLFLLRARRAWRDV